MSTRRKSDVLEKIEKLQKENPTTQRALLYKVMRLEYENQLLKDCLLSRARTLDTSNLQTFRRQLTRKFDIVFKSVKGTKLSTEPKRMMPRQKPEPHLRDIARGLLALCGDSKYHVAGELDPCPEYMEPALQHILTGTYPKIHQSLLEMSNWRPACLEKGVEKTAKCMKEYGQARRAFNKEADLLAKRVADGMDMLERSSCIICDRTSAKVEEEVKELLRTVWDVTV